MSKIHRHKFYIEVLAMPITYILAVLKILTFIPTYIIAWINMKLDEIK
jgi:hypothetical protein